MRILHCEQPWPSKVNFVDENNVFLGYDTQDDCCAQGGWYLSDNPKERLDGYKDDNYNALKFDMKSMDLPGWTFDVSYYATPVGTEQYSEFCAAQFRIVNGDKEKFITLYNNHNGYYGKGFTFTVPQDATKNREDTL